MLDAVPKQTTTQPRYVRFTDGEYAAILGLARKQERSAAQIIQRAVRAYLKMPVDPEPLPPTKAELFGQWFLALPKQLKQVLISVAEQAGHRLPDIPGHERNQRKPPGKAKRPRS